MKRFAVFCGAALVVLTQPAFAQSRMEKLESKLEKVESGLEKLEEGLKVAVACAGDVVRLCKGVLPGKGRITACMREKAKQLSPDCSDRLLEAKALEQGPAKIKLNPGVIPGATMDLPKARDYAYCEIAPFIIEDGKITAEFYNTTATTGVGGGCPPDKFAAIDSKTLAADLAAAVVYMNPTPQTARRHWVMDQFSASQKGETVDFLGVKATWGASMDPRQLQGLVKANYEPGEIHRQTKFLYAKGSPVFLLRSPDGKTWVMQSYATEVDKDLTYDQLSQLASKLKQLPAGWKFEVKTLDKDLTIEPGKARNVAHIVRDELHDVYEGCGFDKACNYMP
jgi:hypothetical protein